VPVLTEFEQAIYPEYQVSKVYHFHRCTYQNLGCCEKERRLLIKSGEDGVDYCPISALLFLAFNLLIFSPYMLGKGAHGPGAPAISVS
jgi:hypothetical protein